ncbi:hypothetical protein Efla_004893 [Eimeria flavescens]
MLEEKKTRELPLGAKEPHLHEPPHDDADRQPSASGVSIDGHAKAVQCIECHYAPRKKRIGTKWIAGVCVVALVSLLLRCHLALSRILMGGLQPRALGASGSDANNDEKEEPLSPHLQELCLEVGHWTPGPSPSEGPRGSPLMVESFLESLVDEQGSALEKSSASELQGAGDWHPMGSPTDGPRASPIMIQSFFEDLEKQASAVFGEAPLAGPSGGESIPGVQVGVKRPASEDNGDESDVPGPSGKVARTGSATLSSSRASSPSATTSSPSWVAGAGAEAATTHSDSAAPSSPTVSITASASSSVAQDSSPSQPAAASQSPSGQGTSAGTAGSAFFWVPTLEPGVKARPFSATVLQEDQFRRTLSPVLSPLRRLLRKRSLNQYEADVVVAYSEQLVNFAKHSMNSTVRRMRPTDMAEAFCRRLLVFYMLDMASRTVQQDWKREPWWDAFAAGVTTTFPEGKRQGHSRERHGMHGAKTPAAESRFLFVVLGLLSDRG